MSNLKGEVISYHIPNNALWMWVDDHYVYAMIPSKDGGLPYIIKHSLSEQGLSKALNLLRTRYEELPSAMKNYTPQSRQPSTDKPSIQTPDQQSTALAVLRKLGMV